MIITRPPRHGLEGLLAIQGLEHNSIYHGALGDFYHQLKNVKEAELHYKLAIDLTKSKSEVELLQHKITLLV